LDREFKTRSSFATVFELLIVILGGIFGPEIVYTRFEWAEGATLAQISQVWFVFCGTMLIISLMFVAFSWQNREVALRLRLRKTLSEKKSVTYDSWSIEKRRLESEQILKGLKQTGVPFLTECQEIGDIDNRFWVSSDLDQSIVEFMPSVSTDGKVVITLVLKDSEKATKEIRKDMFDCTKKSLIAAFEKSKDVWAFCVVTKLYAQEKDGTRNQIEVSTFHADRIQAESIKKSRLTPEETLKELKGWINPLFRCTMESGN